jgi:hypothetical protein
MPTDFFSPEEVDRLQKTTQLYATAKPLILFSEEIDSNSKINPQIWKELRDAFDHFMRVFDDVLLHNKKKRDDNKNYYFENLDKAHGHVYRAAFDALDGASISMRQKIKDLADDHSRQSLQEVIKDYWDIRMQLEGINSRIADLRAKKDVACDETVNNINAYVEILDQLKKIHKTFLNSMPLLKEWNKRNKRNTAKKIILKLFVLLLTIFLTGLITTTVFVPWQDRNKKFKSISIPAAKPTINNTQQADSGK